MLGNVDQIVSHKPDIVVIGAGPAGLSVCLRIIELIPTIRILLLEAGDDSLGPDITDIYSLSTRGDLTSDYYRQHAQITLGGGSSVWNGWCAPLERRAFDDGDWPISYSELERFYPDAAKILDLPPEASETEANILASPFPTAAIATLRLQKYFFSTPTRFADKYRRLLTDEPNLLVVTQRPVSRIIHDAGRVIGFTLGTAGTEQAYRVEEAAFVAACGGLGNPFLLQKSKISPQLPIGNYFSEHPHVYAAGRLRIRTALLESHTRPYDTVPALQFTDTFLREHQLLNIAFSFFPGEPVTNLILGEPTQTYESELTIRAEMPQRIENFAGIDRGRTFKEPATRASINFEFGFEETANRALFLLSEELIRNGVGRLSRRNVSKYNITGGGHFMSTTKMGSSNRTSVVDSDCRVHGIENLFIAGSSVFASGGAANPTFTIVALSLRLAEHLAERHKTKRPER